jgi:hypothetical protein
LEARRPLAQEQRNQSSQTQRNPGQGEDDLTEPSAAPAKRRVHWHVLLTHFPISLFGVCAGFQVLHLFFLPKCFEIATNVCLLGAAAMMIPTTVSGWLTWKRQYRGFGAPVFRKKIVIAYVMLGLSLPLAVWRTVFLNVFTASEWGLDHWIYFSGTIALIIGAALEGYFGGTLHHK